jgi:hypothetical protein
MVGMPYCKIEFSYVAARGMKSFTLAVLTCVATCTRRPVCAAQALEALSLELQQQIDWRHAAGQQGAQPAEEAEYTEAYSSGVVDLVRTTTASISAPSSTVSGQPEPASSGIGLSPPLREAGGTSHSKAVTASAAAVALPTAPRLQPDEAALDKEQKPLGAALKLQASLPALLALGLAGAGWLYVCAALYKLPLLLADLMQAAVGRTNPWLVLAAEVALVAAVASYMFGGR